MALKLFKSVIEIPFSVIFVLDGQPVGPLMKKTSSAEGKWKYASYFLEKSVNASIVLRASRGILDVGDIAIDDLKINSGRCPVISK